MCGIMEAFPDYSPGKPDACKGDAVPGATFSTSDCGKALLYRKSNPIGDPKDIYTKESYEAFIKPFKEAKVSFFLPFNPFKKFTLQNCGKMRTLEEVKKMTLGRPVNKGPFAGHKEQFVALKSEQDAIATEAVIKSGYESELDPKKADQAFNDIIEAKLGIPTNAWLKPWDLDKVTPGRYWNDLLQVSFSGLKTPYMVSGSEVGANEHWVPGGYAGETGKTPTMKEAIATDKDGDLVVGDATFQWVFRNGEFNRDVVTLDELWKEAEKNPWSAKHKRCAITPGSPAANAAMTCGCEEAAKKEPAKPEPAKPSPGTPARQGYYQYLLDYFDYNDDARAYQYDYDKQIEREEMRMLNQYLRSLPKRKQKHKHTKKYN